MKFCVACQDILSDNFNYCPQCGRKLKIKVMCKCGNTFFTYGAKVNCDTCLRINKERSKANE